MSRTYTVPLPALPAMSSNDREHHMARARRVKAWREAAGWACKAERVPRLQRAVIVLHAFPPDKRKRDAHNLAPCLKAAVDGTVDAGVLDDDDLEHLPISYVRIITPDSSGSTLPKAGWTWQLRIEDAGEPSTGDAA